MGVPFPACSATVWRARCLTNNDIVAVKILNLEAQMAPLEDIVHEAQTMKVCAAGCVCADTAASSGVGCWPQTRLS